jgi:hypothetical protein
MENWGTPWKAEINIRKDPYKGYRGCLEHSPRHIKGFVKARVSGETVVE